MSPQCPTWLKLDLASIFLTFGERWLQNKNNIYFDCCLVDLGQRERFQGKQMPLGITRPGHRHRQASPLLTGALPEKKRRWENSISHDLGARGRPHKNKSMGCIKEKEKEDNLGYSLVQLLDLPPGCRFSEGRCLHIVWVFLQHSTQVFGLWQGSLGIYGVLNLREWWSPYLPAQQADSTSIASVGRAGTTNRTGHWCQEGRPTRAPNMLQQKCHWRRPTSCPAWPWMSYRFSAFTFNTLTALWPHGN